MDISITDSFPNSLRECAREILASGGKSVDVYSKLCSLFSPAYPRANILPSQINADLVEKYGYEICRELSFLPISKTDIYLTAVSPTPWDSYKLGQIRALGYDSVRLIAVTDSAFKRLCDYAKNLRPKARAIDREIHAPQMAWGHTPAMNIVRELLIYAIRSGASDVHIEPQEDKAVVKFRINGVLRIQEPVPRAHKKELIDAIKDMATLPLSETKNLSDCRFSLSLDDGSSVDFRVAKIPISGEYENFVLRILDSEKLARAKGTLPFSGGLLDDFESALNAESGMIILTGPTGSGKTTTLYSALMRLDLAELNVRTIEDPIEYKLNKAVQTQIDVKNGVTFPRALRAMLRADPDVIMVGEIRDEETAELAISAANTGHLVLTTLHTRSALGVIPRLQDLGLSRSSIQEAVTLVVSQRLLPCLCNKCKVPVKTTDFQKRHFEFYGITPPKYIYRPLGCPDCGSSGVEGRSPVFEFLRFDSTVRNLMVSNANLEDIAAYNGKRYNSLVKEVMLQIAAGRVEYDQIRNFEPQMRKFLSEKHPL